MKIEGDYMSDQIIVATFNDTKAARVS
jgi:hypothetical protein